MISPLELVKCFESNVVDHSYIQHKVIFVLYVTRRCNHLFLVSVVVPSSEQEKHPDVRC